MLNVQQVMLYSVLCFNLGFSLKVLGSFLDAKMIFIRSCWIYMKSFMCILIWKYGSFDSISRGINDLQTKGLPGKHHSLGSLPLTLVSLVSCGTMGREQCWEGRFWETWELISIWHLWNTDFREISRESGQVSNRLLRMSPYSFTCPQHSQGWKSLVGR